jgi:hypothetical protein
MDIKEIKCEVGYCEHTNEPLGSKKRVEFLDQLCQYNQFYKNDYFVKLVKQLLFSKGKGKVVPVL